VVSYLTRVVQAALPPRQAASPAVGELPNQSVAALPVLSDPAIPSMPDAGIAADADVEGGEILEEMHPAGGSPGRPTIALPKTQPPVPLEGTALPAESVRLPLAMRPKEEVPTPPARDPTPRDLPEPQTAGGAARQAVPEAPPGSTASVEAPRETPRLLGSDSPRGFEREATRAGTPEETRAAAMSPPPRGDPTPRDLRKLETASGSPRQVVSKPFAGLVLSNQGARENTQLPGQGSNPGPHGEADRTVVLGGVEAAAVPAPPRGDRTQRHLPGPETAGAAARRPIVEDSAEPAPPVEPRRKAPPFAASGRDPLPAVPMPTGTHRGAFPPPLSRPEPAPPLVTSGLRGTAAPVVPAPVSPRGLPVSAGTSTPAPRPVEGEGAGQTPARPRQALPSRAPGAPPAVTARAPARPEVSLAIGQIDVTVVNQPAPPPVRRIRGADGAGAVTVGPRLESTLARRGLAWFPLKP
jgi:hypothetical protein